MKVSTWGREEAEGQEVNGIRTGIKKGSRGRESENQAEKNTYREQERRGCHGDENVNNSLYTFTSRID